MAEWGGAERDAAFVMSLITLAAMSQHPAEIQRTSISAKMDSGKTATADLLVNGQVWHLSIGRGMVTTTDSI